MGANTDPEGFAMIARRGIVIHAQDCGDYWAGRLEKTHLNVVGVHPAGGMEAHRSLENCIRYSCPQDKELFLPKPWTMT